MTNGNINRGDVFLNLDCYFDVLNDFFSECDSGQNYFKTVTNEGIFKWDNYNETLLEQLNACNKNSVEHMLAIRYRKRMFDMFRKKTEEIMYKAEKYVYKIYSFLNCFDDHITILSPHGFEKYDSVCKNGEVSLMKMRFAAKFDVDKECETARKEKYKKTDEYLRFLISVFDENWEIYSVMSDYTSKLFENFVIEDDALAVIVERDLKAYCKKERKKVLSTLKAEAKSYKDKGKRSKPLSSEDWGNVLDAEEERIRTMSDSTDGEICKLLEDCWIDEELFDLDFAREKGLLDMLTEKNYIQFFSLVLRHSLIQCEMIPELKPKFEAWLNEETGPKDAAKNEVVRNYPEIGQNHTKIFLQQCFPIPQEVGVKKRVTISDSDILHVIYDFTREWNPEDTNSVHKWRVLYESLKRLKYLKKGQREVYSQFVKSIVTYCFPNVDDNYSGNISKTSLSPDYESWDKKDRELFQGIKHAIEFEE